MLKFNTLGVAGKLYLCFALLMVLAGLTGPLVLIFYLQQTVAQLGELAPSIHAELAALQQQQGWGLAMIALVQVLFAGGVLWLLHYVLVRPLLRLVDAIKQAGQLDLTVHVESQADDELGEASRSLGMLLQHVNLLVAKLESSSQQMEQSTYQIAIISKEIAQAGEQEQVRSVAVNRVTEELHHISAQVQIAATRAADSAGQARQIAASGIQTVNGNINELDLTVQQVDGAASEMAALVSAANQINSIIATIKTIATQTDLLALNAAIEASRAGEQGKGFAVVADEVRQLADKTSRSAIEVSHIVEQLNTKVGLVNGAMTQVVEKVRSNQQVVAGTADIIQLMANQVEVTAIANRSISDNSQRQLNHIGSLKSTLNQLLETLQRNSSRVEATTAIGQGMRQLSGELERMVVDYRFAHVKQSPRVKHELRRVPRCKTGLLLKIRAKGQQWESVSEDFSLGGLRFTLKANLNVGDIIELRLYQPLESLAQYRTQQPVRISARIARVVRLKQAITCGVEFVDLNATQRAYLQQCFDFFVK